MTPEEQFPVQHVTDELKKLVGWGARKWLLALLPNLRQLSGADEDADIRVIGNHVLRFLIAQVSALSGEYEFRGQTYPAHTIRVALGILLALHGITGPSLTRPGSDPTRSRRGRTIMKLGLHISEGQWRNSDDYERALLEILAVQIVTSADSQTGDSQAAA